MILGWTTLIYRCIYELSITIIDGIDQQNEITSNSIISIHNNYSRDDYICEKSSIINQTFSNLRYKMIRHHIKIAMI